MTGMHDQPALDVAIACGGTGGHLFPGLAVATELQSAGCETLLLVSPKEIDRLALQGAKGVRTAVLPAVGLSRGKELAFARGFFAAYKESRRLFKSRPPAAVLSMGGFTGAPPVLAGRKFGALSFLHESNSIPGKANRWLSWVARRAFVGFPNAARWLHAPKVDVTGTPVRSGIGAADPVLCRRELGFDPDRPVLLVTGGSQGATAINKMVAAALPAFAAACGELQFLLLTGQADADLVRGACDRHGVQARVHAFFDRMDLALGAATLAVSRSGASFLAELAAARVPAVLIPYPQAADQHQLHNARAFAESEAAVVCDQARTTPEELVRVVTAIVKDSNRIGRMRSALSRWHTPDSARRISGAILEVIGKNRCAVGCGTERMPLHRHPAAAA